MVPPSNVKITSWLLLAICARFSAHAYMGYQLDYNQSPISYNELNERQSTLKEGSPLSHQSKGYYHPYNQDDSVASATSASPISAPSRSGSSRQDGWKPIVRSQTTSNQHDSYAKIQLRHRVNGMKRDPAGSPRQSRTTSYGYGRPKLRQFQQPPKDTLKIKRASEKPPPKDDLHLAAFQYASKKKDGHILSENDIIWMHYGPQIGSHHQQMRYGVDAGLGYVGAAGKIGQRSYEVRESDIDNTDAEPPPRNIHQVINGSTLPTFAAVGLAKRQTTTKMLLDDEPSSESSVRTYKFGYDDRLVNELPQGGDQTVADSAQLDDDHLEGLESVVHLTGHPTNMKYASPNVDGFVHLTPTSTKVPLDDDTLNEIDSFEPASNPITHKTTSATSTKSSRLLDSPIVIVEPQTTTLTPEYYRQLFESFSSGHYRQTDVDGPLPNKKPPLRAKEKPLPASSTAATPLAASIAISTEKVEASISEQSATQTMKRNETEKSNSSFFTVSSYQLMDLLPETLRVNLVAIKRVLIDCYTPGYRNDNKSGSVNCLKTITFDILDKAIKSDVFELTDTVSLVKENKTASGQGRSATSGRIDQTEWLPNIIERIQQLFSTHALTVKLMNSKESDSYHVEGRQRRLYRRVFPVIVGVYMIFYSILIPLSFKFLLLLGGKTLFMSKVALFLTLISNLKKQAVDAAHAPQYPSNPYYHHHRLRKNDFKRRTSTNANKKYF